MNYDFFINKEGAKPVSMADAVSVPAAFLSFWVSVADAV